MIYASEIATICVDGALIMLSLEGERSEVRISAG